MKPGREKIYEKAYNLYTKIGASAVYDYANELGLNYKYCKPCKTGTPTVDDEDICLVCGNPQEKEKSHTIIWDLYGTIVEFYNRFDEGETTPEEDHQLIMDVKKMVADYHEHF